jgi:serine protease Do
LAGAHVLTGGFPLARTPAVGYAFGMIARNIAMTMVLLGLAAPVAAETIQLKDKATVTGKILSEKKDQVFVDLGYTVLSIPRSQIVKILKAEAKETEPAKTAPVEKISGLYSTAVTPPTEKMVRELVQQLGEGVVQVRTPGGLGSGFILNEEGYLITNFHVIEGETQISIEVYHQKGDSLNRQVYKQIKIIAMNKFADLALLKIEDKDTPKFKKVLLGEADELSVGERVFAIGSPLGLERTVTEGILSTKTREMQGALYLQTTAQINPGNSGGPLFNMRGEVVGVTNMKLTYGEGLGFAIPVEAVKYFLNHRDAYAYDNDNPSNPYRYLDPPNKMKQAQAEKAAGK